MFGHGGEKSRSRTASFRINRASQHWWAWIAVGEVENLAGQVIRALLSGAEGICFSSLPTEDNPLECERLKAIGFLRRSLAVVEAAVVGATKLLRSMGVENR
jgi:type II secretory ATPase GspE/PulE/Tfp pilus assembly ATPase PilB-like protein